MAAASSVSTQVSPCTKSLDGFRLKALGPPLTATSAGPRGPLVEQAMSNQSAPSVTASEKFSCRLALAGKSLAPSDGVLDSSVGALSTCVLKPKAYGAAIGSGVESVSFTASAAMLTLQLAP